MVRKGGELGACEENGGPLRRISRDVYLAVYNITPDKIPEDYNVCSGERPCEFRIDSDYTVIYSRKVIAGHEIVYDEKGTPWQKEIHTREVSSSPLLYCVFMSPCLRN